MERGELVCTIDGYEAKEAKKLAESKSTEPSLPSSTDKRSLGNVEDLSTRNKPSRIENAKLAANGVLPKVGTARRRGEEVNMGPTRVELTLERMSALQKEIANRVYNDSESDDGSNDDLDEQCIKLHDILNGANKIDAKTLGFIACAQETMKYLADQGVPKDNPMVVSLRNRLIEGINRI
ncbi:insensible [Arctopsyche grandis]|uniref:insensible n=1 Tax=Arctopsyche grandis TaxID=121162 RepID=UPI00406D95A5